MCKSYHWFLTLYFSKSNSLLQEPWLLHEFNEDFYGEELRLVVVGYIRPEVSFEIVSMLLQFSPQSQYSWFLLLTKLYMVTGQFHIPWKPDRKDSRGQKNRRESPWSSDILKTQGRSISKNLFAQGIKSLVIYWIFRFHWCQLHLLERY